MRIVLVLILFLSFGCKNYLLDRFTYDEVMDLFIDAHTLGLVYNRQGVKDDDLKDEYYKILEKKYGLTRAEFQQLMEEVVQNSKLYERLYTDIKDRMDKLEREQMESEI